MKRYQAQLSWGLTFAFFCLTAGMAVLKYDSFHSTNYDLGYFFSHFLTVGAYDEFWWAYIGHVQPYMHLWSFVYNSFFPELSPSIILVMQAAFVALVIPYLYKWFSPLVAIAFVLYFPVWYNILFDFHFDHLAIPLLLCFYLFAEKRRFWCSLLPALLLMLVKEPFALEAAACGLFLIVAFRQYLIGSLLMVAGSFYFYVSVAYIIPFFSMKPVEGLMSGAFSWMGTGVGEFILFILSNPLQVLSEVFIPGKMLYLFGIFGALGFISLLRPIYLIPAAPILAISLLSQLPNYYGLYYHYTAGIIVPVLIAFSKGLPIAEKHISSLGISKQSFHFLLIGGMLIAHIVLSPSPVSRHFWSEKLWNYQMSAYVADDRSKVIKKATLEYIPEDPDVSVSTQNSVHYGRISGRKHSLGFPFGIQRPEEIPDFRNHTFSAFIHFIATGEKPEKRNITVFADYVVIDEKRPLFLYDRGCEWFYNACGNTAVMEEFLKELKAAKEGYNTVFEHDGFLILKKATATIKPASGVNKE